MNSHYKAILMVLLCLIVFFVLPILMARYWHFVIVGIIIISFVLCLGIFVVFTYSELKAEMDWEDAMNENLTHNFDEAQKKVYYDSLKILRK